MTFKGGARLTAAVAVWLFAAAAAWGHEIFFVNGSCGNDAWTGLSAVCEAPDGPKATIQAAIDVALVDDTVFVASGVYTGVGNKNLDFGGKLIRVRGAGGASGCIIDCENDGRGVHFRSGEGPQSIFERFTIRNGRVTPGDGGGILCEGSSPTIKDCVFATSFAAGGGGVCVVGGSPTIANCRFVANTATLGGGLANLGGARTSVIGCAFAGNRGTPTGGGMANVDSSPAVTNCSFTNNTATESGGAMDNLRADPTVTNCTLSGNSAGSGGGMYSASNNPTVTNCILWNDGPDEIVDVSGAVTTVRFSDVQGGWPGEGNIDADPLFDTACNSDYGLASGSPCIDAGDNAAVPAGVTSDLCGNPRFVDAPATPDCRWAPPGTCGTAPIVDMGAQEFQGGGCRGDLNGDGVIDLADLGILLADFGCVAPGSCPGDIDGDGDTDLADLGILLAEFGNTCP